MDRWTFGLLVITLVFYFIGRWQIKRATQRVISNAKKLGVEGFEYAPASAEDFPSLDRKFYDTAAEKLKSLGFRCLGDYENLTHSRMFPQMRVFAREFISEDGRVQACCYHINMRGWTRIKGWMSGVNGDQRVCKFETEFQGGTRFLGTSNCVGPEKLAPVPGIFRLYLPPDTPAEELFKRHLEALNRLMEQNGWEPQCVGTAEEFHASQNRMQAVKSMARKSRGYITPDEIRRLGASAPKAAEMVARELEHQAPRKVDFELWVEPGPAKKDERENKNDQ